MKMQKVLESGADMVRAILYYALGASATSEPVPRILM